MLNSKASWRLLAGGAVAGGAVVLALTGALASASATPAVGESWQITKLVHSGDNSGFGAVTAADRKTVWAFIGGTTPAAWRRNGSRWKRFAIQGPVISASATAARNAWAITQSGQVLRWTGAAWVVSHVFRGASQIQALGPGDVWVFGSAWEHYDGRTWSQMTTASGLVGASALSDTNIWSFGQATVAHWNGHILTRTSVKKLLIRKNPTDNPGLVGIYAQSKNNIWAIGNGDTADAGGPLFILHNNGHGWRRVLVGQLGSYGGNIVAPDGHGGLWIPLDGASGGPTTVAHFFHGKLTTAKLPVPADQIRFLSVAPIPGTTEALAGGFAYPGSAKAASVVLQYSP